MIIHRTKYSNHETFYATHYNGLLAPPEISEPVLNDVQVKTYNLEPYTDVLISGLAFVTVRDYATVEVKVPAGVEVYIRPSIFRGKN